MPQKSDEWFRIRLGKPCSSEFSRIVTSTGAPSKSRRGYAMQLATELYANGPTGSWGGNMDIQRGRHLEDDALSAYSFTRECELEIVGCCTDDDETMLCSPDALVETDGVAEVKCPNAERMTEYILRYQKDATIDPAYIQQTQGQMLITGREWVDLIFFNVHLPMLVVRQYPIPAVQTGLLHGIAELLEERDEILKALQAQRDGVPF